jgi:hypothetical protein
MPVAVLMNAVEVPAPSDTEGDVEGAVDGSREIVGVAVIVLVGEMDLEGLAVGTLDGLKVGISVGEEGMIVGALVGRLVGIIDGPRLIEGEVVGTFDGTADGFDGLVVGTYVGLVANTEGADVGL